VQVLAIVGSVVVSVFPALQGFEGGFEGDPVGEPPRDWVLPKGAADGGFRLEVTDASAAGGQRSARLSGARNPSVLGTCERSIDARALRAKRVRFSAAVRCEPEDAESGALLWLSVDRPEGQSGFVDNEPDRPIRSEAWQRYEIVGDVADDADRIVLGMMLIGGGSAMLDDVVLEVVDGDVPSTVPAPGLVVAEYDANARVRRTFQATQFRFPLPLAYRDQTPLTFRLELEPADVDASVAIVPGPGPNHVLELELRGIEKGTHVRLRYESLVLVSPTSFEGLPRNAEPPARWPEEAEPWLQATWCCDSGNERIRAIGSELRAAGGGVVAIVEAVLRRSQEIFAAAEAREGYARNMTAVEALDKAGNCTSCANLVAALLRAAGIPARILAGYPLGSGPLSTHYIVEAWVPGFGWYPVESTRGRASWPNHQLIAVSVIPIENESEALAGPRSRNAGGTPYLSLTEYASDAPLLWEGPLRPTSDHEGRMLRPLTAEPQEWQATQEWARQRWTKWLESKPQLANGKLEFGPSSAALAAKALAELRLELP